jgi:dUTP pyrophosphatase
MRKFEFVEDFKVRWYNMWESHQEYVLRDVIWNPEYPKLMKDEFIKRRDKDWELFIQHFLPKRHSKHAACYDIRAGETKTIFPSLYKVQDLDDSDELYYRIWSDDGNVTNLVFLEPPTMVRTGIKVKMNEDEVLEIYNRSSFPTKKGLMLANNVGIIDYDYYDTLETEGEILLPMWNFSNEDILIQMGDRIAQAKFCKYLTTDDDTADGERIGGFGSTGV